MACWRAQQARKASAGRGVLSTGRAATGRSRIRAQRAGQRSRSRITPDRASTGRYRRRRSCGNGVELPRGRRRPALPAFFPGDGAKAAPAPNRRLADRGRCTPADVVDICWIVSRARCHPLVSELAHRRLPCKRRYGRLVPGAGNLAGRGHVVQTRQREDQIASRGQLRALLELACSDGCGNRAACRSCQLAFWQQARTRGWAKAVAVIRRRRQTPRKLAA